MVVNCEKCGKRYRVDPAKIKGRAASFNCHICSHVIMVQKVRTTSQLAESDIDETSTTRSFERLAADGADLKKSAPSAKNIGAGTPRRHRAGRFGLRAKMILVFFLIPSMLMVGVSLFYLWRFETTSHLLVQEITKIENQRPEEKGAGVSAATAVMKSRTKALTGEARMMALLMLGAAILLIGIIVLAYANRLAGRIESLADAADRIGAGELEMEIETKSRDEIGDLIQAITRIRDNIRLYMERFPQRP